MAGARARGAAEPPTGTLGPALAVFGSSAIWGLFWVPLQYFAAHGVTGLWSTLVIMGLPVPVIVPLAWWRGEFRREQARSLVLVGIGGGVSLALYAAAIVHTDVIRAIFLFYLMPIWTALYGLLALGEPVRPLRALAIALGLGGLWLLLGGATGWPLPQNRGDLYGLAAGIIFGVTIAWIRRLPAVGVCANNAALYVIGFAFAIALTLVSPGELARMPDADSVVMILPVALVVCWLLALPSNLALYWAAKFLSPVTTGMLMMSEVVVGAASAAVLIGTEMSPFEIAGSLVILVAVVADLASQVRK
jgi:drug/metabolite transporter (DMT)-like permease